MTEETKKKISDAIKKRGLPEGFGGGNNKKPLINSEGTVFDTIKDATEFYNVSRYTIASWIKKGKFGLKRL